MAAESVSHWNKVEHWEVAIGAGVTVTSARWQTITKIFTSALDKCQSERNGFVREACAGDVELEAEVARLLAADEDAGSFLERPALNTPLSLISPQSRPMLSAGTIISNRFEILDFIGEGGMGQVYKVLDLELRERIALKTIRPDISSDPGVLSRFKREVQLTRRITHPNVCRTFDIERHACTLKNGIQNDFVFLTMELLEGETLAEWLGRQGCIGTRDALPLVRQMVGALAAAHRVGVIHRDFKPSNVILVPSDSGFRLVVTDFGLAHTTFAEGSSLAALTDAPLSSNRGLMGTLAYMAPEQLERGEATAATDIYALGLVIYEMVTGERPFASDGPFGQIFRRLKQQPPSPRIHCPDLLEAWENTIQRCLELVPEARFANIEEVASSLDQCVQAGELPKKNRFQRIPFVNGSLERQGKAKRSIVLITILVALFGGALRFYKWKPENARVPEGSGLFLSEISNQSGDPGLDGVTEMLRSELAESSYVNLIATSRVREVLARMAHPVDENLDPVTAREVALRDGASLVLFGTVSRVAEDYKLDLKLERVGIDPARPKNSWKFAESAAGRQELLESIHRGGLWVRHLIGEAETDIETTDRRPEEVTTKNWEALKLYARGQNLAASDRLEDAILVFKEAVEKDPEFAMGWMRIGDILDTIGQSGDGFAYWRKALAVSGDRRLSPREELRIKGMFANDTGDLLAAVEYFGQYSIEYPNDYLGYFYRGYPLMLLGKTEQAIAVLEQAETRAPKSFEIADHLARYSLILGDFPSAERYIARVREFEHADNADQLEGQMRFLQGHYQGAQDLFSNLRISRDPYLRSVSYQLEAGVLAEQGRYREAVKILYGGAASDLAPGDSADRADKFLALAYLYLKQGAKRDSSDAALKSLTVSYSPERVAEAGSILSRAGNVSEAKKLLRNLDISVKTPIAEVSHLRLTGEILLAEGQGDKALTQLQKAWDLDQKRALLRDYWVRALVANRRWDEALQTLGQILEHPGQVWHQAELYAPGAASDLLFLQAKISFQLGRPEAKQLLSDYSERRRGADFGLPEVSAASVMLKSRK
jgi:serine/threonine protein kinase/tetratricopeptide (TPR) repeat protein